LKGSVELQKDFNTSPPLPSSDKKNQVPGVAENSIEHDNTLPSGEQRNTRNNSRRSRNVLSEKTSRYRNRNIMNFLQAHLQKASRDVAAKSTRSEEKVERHRRMVTTTSETNNDNVENNSNIDDHANDDNKKSNNYKSKRQVISMEQSYPKEDKEEMENRENETQEEKMNRLKEQKQKQLMLKYFVEWLQNCKEYLQMSSHIQDHNEMIAEHCLITAPKVTTITNKTENENENENAKEYKKKWQTNFVCWKPNDLFVQECKDHHDTLSTQSKARSQKLTQYQQDSLKPPPLSLELKKKNIWRTMERI